MSETEVNDSLTPKLIIGEFVTVRNTTGEAFAGVLRQASPEMEWWVLETDNGHFVFVRRESVLCVYSRNRPPSFISRSEKEIFPDE